MDNASPDFTNELGVKWWLEKHLTEYARSEDSFGTSLKNASVWKIEEPDGRKSRLLIIENKVVADLPGLEAMVARIDFDKLVKRMTA